MINLAIRIILFLFNQLRSYLKRQRKAREEYLAQRRRAIITYVYAHCNDNGCYDDISRILLEYPVDNRILKAREKPIGMSHHHMELLHLLHRLRVRPRRVAQ